jgi:hypothetical protein
VGRQLAPEPGVLHATERQVGIRRRHAVHEHLPGFPGSCVT